MDVSEKLKKQDLRNDEPSIYTFRDLDPTEYYGFVTESINYNNIKDLSHTLESIALPDGVIITVTGSDGKLERHAQSKTELVIIEENASLKGDDIVRDFFGMDQYDQIFDVNIDGVIDTKILDSPEPVSYAFHSSEAVYPDRILNAFPVHPLTDKSLELYFRAREKALVEMSTDKNIRNKMKDQLRTYRRSIRTGEYRHQPLFDARNCLQYYNEERSVYTTGFKIPFLRVVQRKLDMLTLELAGQKSWSDVAREAPTTTLGRLGYLAHMNIVSEEEAAKTSGSYAWFLQQYHFIQEDYKQERGPITLAYDPDEFEKHSRAVEEFSKI